VKNAPLARLAIGMALPAKADASGPAGFFSLMMKNVMATESTEKHGKIKHALEFLPCPSVDSVATKNTGAQPDLSASIMIKLHRYSYFFKLVMTNVMATV
jgi:hypothetical protein